MAEQRLAREAADKAAADANAGEAGGVSAQGEQANSQGSPPVAASRTGFVLPADLPDGDAAMDGERLSEDEVMSSFDGLDVDIPEDRKRELISRFIELAAKRHKPQ